MTDLVEFREAVLEARHARIADDPLSCVAVDGVTALFNKLVRPEMQVGSASQLRVTVEANGRVLTGRDTAQVVDRFSRAVASLAAEISAPSTSGGRLSQSDYAKAPLYVAGAAGSTITLSPQSGDVYRDGTILESLASQALVRLVNLLPESTQDDNLAIRVLASRVPTARAIDQVAQVARRLDGIAVHLTGGRSDAHAVLDDEQARMVTELLKDTTTQVQRQRVSGRLDGMRFKRREFFLEVGDDHDIVGTVDEDLVARIPPLLDQRVIATLEQVVRTTAAGVRRRPAYRLIDIQPEATLDS